MALTVAFDAIEGYLGGIGRPPTALCACELRSPAQFTDAGFVAFNRHYVERLAAWGIFRDPPATPSFYAFSYTVPSEDRAARSFVAAGSGEARTLDAEAGLGGNPARILELVGDEAVSAGWERLNGRHGGLCLDGGDA